MQKANSVRNSASGWVPCCDDSGNVVLCVAADSGAIRQDNFEVAAVGWKLIAQNRIQVEIDQCFESILKTCCLATVFLHIDRRSGLGYHNLPCRVVKTGSNLLEIELM